MPKENERLKRYRKKEPENTNLNYKAIFFIIFAIIAVAIRIMPSSEIKDNITLLVKTNTDYPKMFTEITAVIKKHTLSDENFNMPLSGEITSPFGNRIDPISGEESKHLGIDINAPLNSQVHASKGGIVTRAETNEYYGNFIMIDHGEGLSTLYGHLNEIKVSSGDKIKQNDVIALSGDSGKSTGPHLHFEIRKNNEHTNPEEYLK